MPPPLSFIVSVFNFFDRKDLEIVSNTGKYVNRIVRKHFPSKPYRFLNDVTMDIFRDEDGLTLSFMKFADDESSGSQDADDESSESLDAENQSSGSQDADEENSGSQDADEESSGSQDADEESLGSQEAENQSTGFLYLNPYKNEWMGLLPSSKDTFALEVMRPYLSQFVRFRRANLYCDEHPYTPEDVTILASISHAWSGRLLSLGVCWKMVESPLEPPMNVRNNASYSFRNILANDAIFSSRCLDFYDAAQFVSLQDYSRVYTVDALLLKSYFDDPLDIGTLLALIEHKHQFPESKTVFVVDISTFETREAQVTDTICKSFSSASTQCPFQLVIIDDESNGESEEFRLENETTREVLQLKNVKKDSSFVTKICEDCNRKEFQDKFNLIERSRF